MTPDDSKFLAEVKHRMSECGTTYGGDCFRLITMVESRDAEIAALRALREMDTQSFTAWVNKADRLRQALVLVKRAFEENWELSTVFEEIDAVLEPK